MSHVSMKQVRDAYESWYAQGPETKRALVGLLPDDWSFEGKRVLDFGCGDGRTLREFLPEAEHGEFWGADIDAPSIARLKETICPPVHARRCEVDPPLGLEYGSFDLAWAVSVFTHLADNSIPWLLELHRLLRPGGLLIATYIGRWNSEYVAGEPWDEDRIGMNVLRHNQPWAAGGPNVLISDWWLRAHWGRAFEIVEIEPRIHNMSWALMRKRDVELTTEDVERPEDDPREYRAARHNLRQIRPEVVLTQAMYDTAVEDVRRYEERLEDVRREYETSTSWRITRPLREMGRIVRSLSSRWRR